MARLCFILDNLLIGGVERNTIHICNHLSNAGHEITLLCLTSAGPMADSVSDKVVLHYLGVKRVRWALFELRSYLSGNDFDAVISAKEYNNVIAIAAARLCGKDVRVITTTRTHLIEEKDNGRSKIFAATLCIAKWLYPLAWKRIAVSRGVAESVKDALKLPKLDVGVIYNPAADPLKFNIDPPAPHAWFNDPEVPVLVTCGRLTLAKDYAFLLDSFAELRKIMDVRLIVVGDGELRNELEDQITRLNIGDSALLYGFSSKPEDFMFHARLFVMTSKWEGFGNVLVEALSVGCPIVALDCPGGVSEILEDGRWGTLVKGRDAKYFADIIADKLRSQIPSRPRLDLQARARDFTPEKIAADYLSLLN